jgi:metal-responsive CopG/Arc/MetJ family transcriptional regulator
MNNRCATGGSVGVSVRLPEELLNEIDVLAEQERRTRGDMLSILLEDALKVREGRSDVSRLFASGYVGIHH